MDSGCLFACGAPPFGSVGVIDRLTRSHTYYTPTHTQCSTQGARFAVFLTTSESEGFDALHALLESWRQQQQPAQQGILLQALARAGDVPEVSRVVDRVSG